VKQDGRIGQVIKRGKVVYNVFVECQFSVADDGPGQPDWQVFLGLCALATLKLIKFLSFFSTLYHYKNLDRFGFWVV
jgi:hypothetical protein